MTRLFRWAGLIVFLLLSLAACRTGGEPVEDSEPPPDTTSPTVRITAPGLSSDIFVGEAFELHGTSADDTGVSHVAVSVADGEPSEALLQTDGTWKAEITLTTAGKHTITVTAFDAAGNGSEAAEVSYLAHHRGRSLFVDTFNFRVGTPTAGVRVYEVLDGVIDRTAVPATAEVTLNGTVLPYVAEFDNFQGPVPSDLFTAGGPLELTVKDGATVASVGLTLPEVPTITAPADGSSFAVGEAVTFTWEIDANPDYYQILLLPNVAYSGWSEHIPGEARSFTIDVSDLPTDGSDIRARLVAFNTAGVSDFTGPAAWGSKALGDARSGFTTFSIGSGP